MKYLNSLFKTHSLIIIIFVYFVFRLLFLTRLPVFNDEAIYLDWGFKEITLENSLFYSLHDGKQPLLMWIFGVSQKIFQDPLFAGRFISVLTGLITLIGIFKISINYFSKRIALISCFIYILVPLFSSYDRLALMESTISALSIWVLYYFLVLLNKKDIKHSLIVGVLLGLGYFVKSNMLIFLLTIIILLFYNLIRNKMELLNFIKILSLIFIGFLSSTFYLLLQPLFWETLKMNERYSLSIGELVRIPIKNFFDNLIGNLEIGLVFITPIIFILGVIFVFKSLRNKDPNRIISVYFLINIFIQMILVRDTSQRYVISFLPLIALFSGAMIESIKQKEGKLYYLLLIIALIIPFFLTFIQISNPVEYVKFTKPFSNKTESGFIEGQISGYGINETVSKIKILSKNEPLIVTTAINIGNPESSIRAYFNKSENIKVGYLDRRMFSEKINEYDCIKPSINTLYVSRDFQQSEMNNYLTEIDRIKQSNSIYSIGIYKFKDCELNFIELNPLIFLR